MVELTFIIAVLNISLGFAVATYLGYGPPGLLDAFGSLGEYRPHFHLPRYRFPKLQLTEILKKKSPPPEPEPESEPEQSPMEAILPATADFAEMFDAGAADDLSIQPFEEPYDDDVAEMMSPTMPEQWDLNEKYVETSILRLNIAMIKSGIRATEIDTRLRACRGHSDHETIETCLRLLREDCISYLAEQSEAAEKFSARISELGELSSLGEDIEMTNLEQSAQVETTINNLEYMDFRSDPEAANQRLLEEIKNLRSARHKLRDNQEAAFLAIARYENRIDKIEKQLFIDNLTKLRNRIGLEETLSEWWKQGRQKSRPISFALFDADRFGLLNEQHGPMICDRVLFHLGQLLHSSVGKADLVARHSGQRFFVALLDAGPRAALKSIELMRQTIEKATFLYEDKKLQLTVGGVFVEIKPSDEYHSILERMEKTMKLVKEAGPNHTYQHNERDPEPVESPSFGAEEKDIPI